jgi:hypothetical protein
MPLGLRDPGIGGFLGPGRGRDIRPGAARLVALHAFRLGAGRRRRRAGRRGRRPVVVGEAFAESSGLRTVASAALGAVGSFRSFGSFAMPLLRAGRRRGAGLALAFLGAAAASVVALASALAWACFGLLGRGVAIIVLGFHVGDVQETVAADGEVDEGSLDRRLEIDDLALVDVAGVALVAGALDVQLLKDAILDDGDAAFLGLEHIDQHFFLHAGVFLTHARLASVG